MFNMIFKATNEASIQGKYTTMKRKFHAIQTCILSAQEIPKGECEAWAT